MSERRPRRPGRGRPGEPGGAARGAGGRGAGPPGPQGRGRDGRGKSGRAAGPGRSDAASGRAGGLGRPDAASGRGGGERGGSGRPEGSSGRPGRYPGPPGRAARAAGATGGASREGGAARHADAPASRPRTQILYGRNAVREALRAGRRRVRRIWATAATAREGWDSAKVSIVDADELERRCGSDAHQGICAEVDPYPYADPDALLAAVEPLIVVLDEVTDPQNLGAICRTAECAGATGVVIPERRAAEVTAAACKASAGAVEHLPVARVRNVADFLADAKAAGCWCYGAAAGAPTPYDEPDYSGGVVLVLGAEGKGLRPRVASACDALVSLPLRGHIASLNVSAAAAVLLYGMLHRRDKG